MTLATYSGYGTVIGANCAASGNPTLNYCAYDEDDPGCEALERISTVNDVRGSSATYCAYYVYIYANSDICVEWDSNFSYVNRLPETLLLAGLVTMLL